MMKHSMSVVVWLGALAVTATLDRAQGDPAKAQEKAAAKEPATALPNCPVMDEPISLAASVRTDDGPVFFCCDECIKKYQANPSKYADKVAAQRQALATRPKVQTACPVTGEPAKADVTVDHSGGKVQLCCKGCISKFQKDPAKYKANLANSYTYQTKCPVSGEDISPEAFTAVAGGQKVYFCCKNCVKKYTAEPANYEAKLAAQGFVFEHEEDGKEKAKNPTDK